MYLWYIDVKRCGTNNNENQKWRITLSCNFSIFYIATPFDHMIFTATEDNWITGAKRVITEGEEYRTRFYTYENNIAKLIKSLLCNRVVRGHHYFVNDIDHIIDRGDIYIFPWGRYGDMISCLQKINDLMFDTLLV